MASLPVSSLHCPLFPSRLRRPNPHLRPTPRTPARRSAIAASQKTLPPLYDDGYLTPRGIGDYIEAVGDVVKYDADGGPPRWFCPIECGPPVKDAPLLLFLPDISGVGMGLFMHHTALGRIFEVRCMHVPFSDRTPFEGLVQFVEDVLGFEHSGAQTKPIYLMGHSFGACLALAVAARNPNLGLILILSNPATSFGKAELQPFFPILRSISYGLDIMFPFLLSFNMGMQNEHLSFVTCDRLSANVLSLLPHIQKSVDVEQYEHHILVEHLTRPELRHLFFKLQDSIPVDIVSWKLKLLECAACYCNSRLHVVKAEVLLLASCLDGILPIRDEVTRLGKALLNSHVYYLKDHGHCLLLESGVHISSIIKGSGFYRRTSRRNYVLDYLPASMTELEVHDTDFWPLYAATNPVMFSTLEDGEIVRGLSGIPRDGPVVLVGNHMLLGVEVFAIIFEFLRQTRIVLRGMGHPTLFPKMTGSSSQGRGVLDTVKIFGGVPVSPRNFYKLMSEKSHVLLYPGGVREALHRKGEEYTLFWPRQPEFVRMASQFGATIVPFGCVGEDDVGELVLDYNDFMEIPFTRYLINEINQHANRLRTDVEGEVSQQDFHFPGLLPKIPGRFYYLFGKPIETRGLEDILKNRKNANGLYSEIKTEIESMLSYLQKKREGDPYRNIFRRILYQLSWNYIMGIPTFEP